MTKTELRSYLERRCAHLSAQNRERTISHVLSLYEAWSDTFVDPDFEGALRTALRKDNGIEFQQRYWEMFLAQHLKQAGHRIARKKSGPDFWFEVDGKKIWIEAVAPERSADIDAHYRAELLNSGGWFHADPFHLRWTQAIREKVNKYSEYLKKGIVDKTDVCIVALNAGLLGSLGMVGKSDYPALVDVVFGAGAEYAVVDRASMKIVDQGYQREPVIMKGKSPVAKHFFLEADTRHVSAILASGVSPEVWTPIIAAYNPHAPNSLPPGNLGAQFEYYAEECGDHYVVKTIRRENGDAPARSRDTFAE
ncbi:MAG TPA: hypothetical protein VNZ53_04105 [Steroidobacteraceae bacterium]|jgi:hypothetical protein|nr:hypothetical protein [Steroidobacteraceae bacterium]